MITTLISAASAELAAAYAVPMILLELDPEVVKPGWVPLVILIVMFIALFFLYRSMRKQFSKIDSSLPYRDELGPDGRPRPAAKEPVGSPKSPDV